MSTIVYVRVDSGAVDTDPGDSGGVPSEVDFGSGDSVGVESPVDCSIFNVSGGAVRDPWGNPYALENDLTYPGPTNYVAGGKGIDVWSRGPDGITYPEK